MNLKNIMMAGILLVGLTNLSHAVEGGDSGGGGDATEARVDEIRNDIFKWVNNGGPSNLDYPSDLTIETYVKKMSEVLVPKYVVVGFTQKEVLVGTSEKTCKGYVDQETKRKHILCNIPRFQNTSESEQYRLIHHEYAGLVNVEKNDGESSDYVISNQLTDFLVEKTVLRLAIKKEEPVDIYNPKRVILKNVVICSVMCNEEITGHLGHDLARIGTIYYAEATEENNHLNTCMSNAESLPLYSDRMDERSVKNCTKALTGKFRWKSVDIDTHHPDEAGAEDWYLSIKVNPKKKK
ncbi:hypothetical protein SHI21_09660 [Bacteriovorax sp. PP10]|uniref:Uncharacterized protein n=1 Tax=Bacteriovorax antarcticus TaxID=3088717 RepID=A0ABU5VTT6_9BACT|nr:hypothetical protein [Bacteriovorax sp. PP10]MEA9356470.1 hypothetical protein [Bacteriovorax sp. PP10]